MPFSIIYTHIFITASFNAEEQIFTRALLSDAQFLGHLLVCNSSVIPFENHWRIIINFWITYNLLQFKQFKIWVCFERLDLPELHWTRATLRSSGPLSNTAIVLLQHPFSICFYMKTIKRHQNNWDGSVCLCPVNSTASQTHAFTYVLSRQSKTIYLFVLSWMS